MRGGKEGAKQIKMGHLHAPASQDESIHYVLQTWTNKSSHL